MVQQLKQRDREVRTHEMAHLASAGQYARGGPTYSYQQGPDGKRYAVGGEVPIDMSKEKTPEETLQKMQAIRRAALAPAEPSPTDRSVAASAAAMESQARRELQTEQTAPPEEQADNSELSAADNDAEQPAAQTADVQPASQRRRHTFSAVA